MPVNPHEYYLMQRRRQARYSYDVYRYRQKEIAKQVAAQQAAQQQYALSREEAQRVQTLREVAESQGQTYVGIRAGLEGQKLEAKLRLQRIRGAPEDALFYTAGGEKITRDTAIRRLEQQHTDLMVELANVKRFEKEGYSIREAQGKLEFYKTPEQIRQDAIGKKAQQLETFYTKGDPLGFVKGLVGAGERLVKGDIRGAAGRVVAGAGQTYESLAGQAHYVSTGWLSWEDPLHIKSTVQAATGDRRGAIRTKAAASIDLDAAIKQGLPAYALKAYTGPFATVGFSFAGGAGVHAAAGKATEVTGKWALSYAAQTGVKAAVARATPYLLKGGMVATGAVMGGLAVKDVYETYQRDPLLAGAKAITLAAAIYGGYKGWKSLEGTKWSMSSRGAAAKEWYYTKHPKGKYEIPYKGRLGVEVKPKTKFEIGQKIRGQVAKLHPERVKGRVKDLYHKIGEFKVKEFMKKPHFKKYDTPAGIKIKLAPGQKYPTRNIIGKELATPKGAAQPKPTGLNWSNIKYKISFVKGRVKHTAAKLGYKKYKPGDTYVFSASKKGGASFEMYRSLKPYYRGVELSAEGEKIKPRPLLDFLKTKIIKGRSPVYKTKLGQKRIFDFAYLETTAIKKGPKVGGLLPGPDDIPTGKVPPVSDAMSFKGRVFDFKTGKWASSPDPGGVTISKAGGIPGADAATAQIADTFKPVITDVLTKSPPPIFEAVDTSKAFVAGASLVSVAPGVTRKGAGSIGDVYEIVGKTKGFTPADVVLETDQAFKQPIKERMGQGLKLDFIGKQRLAREIMPTSEIAGLVSGDIDLRDFQYKQGQALQPEIITSKYKYQLSAQPQILISGQGLRPEFLEKQRYDVIQDVVFDMGTKSVPRSASALALAQRQQYDYMRAFGQLPGTVEIPFPEIGGPVFPPFELDLWGGESGDPMGIYAFGRSRKHPLKDIRIVAKEMLTGKIQGGHKSGKRRKK